jgi:hypothetical protein
VRYGARAHTLTVHTEKVAVAGKRVTALYLVPEGFEVGEDNEGYVQIVRSGEALSTPVADVEADGPKDGLTPEDDEIF